MKKSIILQRVCHDIYQLRLALMLLLVYAVTTQFLFQTVCPFAILTGFACPACGMTRAVLFMLSGKIITSLSLHPIAFLWCVYFFYLVFFRYVQGRHAPLTRLLCILLSLLTLVYYCFRLAKGTLPEVPGTGIWYLVFDTIG